MFFVFVRVSAFLVEFSFIVVVSCESLLVSFSLVPLFLFMSLLRHFLCLEKLFQCVTFVLGYIFLLAIILLDVFLHLRGLVLFFIARFVSHSFLFLSSHPRIFGLVLFLFLLFLELQMFLLVEPLIVQIGHESLAGLLLVL